MNYLAHLALSARDPHSLVGSIMGDFQKHIRGHRLPVNVQLAIKQHKAIDKFTDSHPQVLALKPLFSQQRRRFAPIIIDVTFDHFLSLHWQSFHDENKHEFILYSYACLEKEWQYQPEQMRKVARYMIAEDCLGSYGELAGVELTLNRLARRIRFPNLFHDAIEEVHEHYIELEQCFLAFYPQLLTFSASRNF